MKSNKNRPTRFYVSLIVLISLIFVFQKVEAFEYKPGYNLSPILKSGNEIFNRLNARFVSASDIQLFVSRPAKISGGNLIKIGQAINQLASQLSFSLENKNTSYFAIIAEQAQNAVAVPPIFIDQEKIIGVFNEVVGGVRSFFGQELVSIPEKKEIGPQPLSPTLQILTEEQKKNLKDIGAKAAATAKQAAKAVFEAVKPKSEMETTAEKVSSVPVIDIAEEQEKLKEEVAAAKEKATDFFNQRFIEEPGKMSVWPISPAVAREQRQKMAEDIRNLFNNLGGFFTKEEIIAQPEERTLIDEGTINLLAAKISAKLPQVQQVLKETRVEKETQTKETQIFIDEKKVQAVAGALEQLKQKQAQDRQDLFSAISLTGRINNISNVTITNPTFSSGAITDGDIPDTITASNYLALSGGTLTGNFLANAASSTITNLTVVNATSTNATTTTLYVSGNVGIGTTSPSEQFAVANRIYVGGSGTSTIENNLQVRGQLKIGTSSTYISGTEINATENFTIRTLSENNHLVLQSLGRVGVSSSTPWGVLSVERNGSNALMPIFVVAEQGTSSPYFIVNDLGRVGIGTTTPGSLFSIQGNALFSGNLSVANLIATGTTRFNGTTYTWPSTGGSANQALLTDGAGTLSWGQGGELANWNKQSNFGVLTLTPTTTIPVWLKDNLYASSSVLIDGNATTTGITYSRGGFISSASSTVAGSLQIAGLLQASSSLSVGGGTALGSTLSVAGTSTLAGLSAGFGTFSSNLVTSGSLSATNLATLSGGFLSTASSTVSNNFIVTGGLNASSTLTVAGASRFYSTFQADSLSTLVGGILANNASSTITNLSIINATSTNATTTSLAVTGNASTSRLVVSNSATLNTLIGNGLFTLNSGLLSTASSTFSSNLNVSGPLSASSTLLVANLSTLTGGFISQASSTIIGNFIVSGGLNASSTLTVAGNSIFYSNVGLGTTTPGALLAVQGNALFSGNLDVANITATGTVTAVNFAATGSTTLQNFTANNSTSTNATTTSLAVTGNASTSRLVVSNSATLNTLIGNGLFTLNSGLLSTASSTFSSNLNVSGPLSASSTLLVANLSTLSGGFISSASSTIASSLHISGNLQASSTVSLATTTITVNVASTTPGIPLTLYNTQSATNTANRLAFQIGGATSTLTTSAITSQLIQNYDPGKGILAFSVLNSGLLSEAARFNSDGYYGIGTTDPAAPLQVTGKTTAGNDSSTKLLLHADGSGSSFTDSSSGGKVVTANDNVVQSNVQSKFGGKSAYFDGNGDYLSMADNADFNVGSGDFTIDTWFYAADTSNRTIFASNSDFYLGMFLSSGKMQYFVSSNGTSWDMIWGDSTPFNGLGSITITTNAWHHLAFVRNGDRWIGFIDGVIDIDTTVTGTVATKNEAKNIGRWGNGSYWFNGYIDEFRFSKGIARWTAAFTPSTDAYGTSLGLAAVFQGNVGIGETAPGSNLSVSGGVTIGASYDTTAAPTNGLLVEGNLGIGTTTPGALLAVQGTGLFTNTLTAPNIIATGTLNVTGVTTLTNASTTGMLTIGNGFISQASSTLSSNLQVSGIINASSTLTVAGASRFYSTLQADALSTLAGGLLANNASSTITNLSIINATSTNATTTSLAVTGNASTSQLVVSNASTYGGLANFLNGLISAASSTFSNILNVTGLANLSGFISTASSTVSNNFIVTGGLNASSTLTVAGNSIFYSNVGIGTTSPGALLAVQGNALFSGNLNVANITATGTISVTGTSGTSTIGSLTISPSGKIGIGTSTPNLANFEVATRTIAFNSGADGDLGRWATSTNTFDIRTNHSSVAANGYVYVLGGLNGSNIRTNAAQYAKLNSDGTVGSWATSTNTFAARSAHSSVVANGYIYVLGGLDGSAAKTNTVQYAKLNSDGTVGSWATSTNTFAARSTHSSIASNGYVYVLGGRDGNNDKTNTVQYAKLNSDGSVGIWATSTNSFAAKSEHSSVIANGYVYVLGGRESSGPLTNTAQYAKLNSDGTVGPWATSTNTFAARADHSSIAANGSVYVLGGMDGNSRTINIVQYAKLNSDGTVGPWATSTNTFAARISHSSVTANGYVYVLGGIDGNSVRTNTAQYASTARILVSGNLDLLGLASTTLGDVNSSDFGSVGGSIFAGNIFSAGQLEVTGNTRLWGGLGVNGVLSVTASTSLAQDVPIFSIQNATGTSPILTALYNGNVGIGTAAPVALLSVAGKTALGANAVNLSARNTLSGGRTYIINNEQYVLALGRDTVNQVFYLGTSAITNPDLQFSNNTGTELMRITDSGNVGIGTSTPGALLAVQGNALFSGNLNVANITATGTLSLTGTTGTSTIASGQGFTIGGSQFVVQQGSGNVGIGTTGPLGGLHVVRSYVDSLNASVRVAGNIPGISFDDTDGAATNRNFAILNSYNNVGLLDFNYSSAQGGAPTLTAMTIDGSAGNVGIGTTSPAQLLAVAGDVYIHNGATQENLRVNNGAVCADNNGATKCNAALTAGASYFDSENIGASDLAENYPVKDESIEAGDIVALTSDISASQNQEKERFKDKAERENSREAEHMQEMLSTTLVKATPETSYKIIGAISTNPGITLGDTTGMTLDTETRPVALSGRIPVKVNLEGGAIVVGDPITISSIPGVGKKANQSGKIIGYALENYNGLTKENGDKILAFTSVGYWLGPDILNATSTNSSLALSQSNGLLAQVVDTVKAWLESMKIFIEDGIVRLKNLVVEKITVKQLCVEDVCVDKAGLQALLLNAGINSLSATSTTAIPASSASAPSADTATTSVSSSSTPLLLIGADDTEPPIITLIGESVITIEKGISWVDPGATVTDNVNDNLGIYYKVDGIETGNGGRDLPQTAIDTNVVASHTITYTSTDSAGNIGAAARTVNIVDPAVIVSDTATTTTTTATTATTTATTTNP